MRCLPPSDQGKPCRGAEIFHSGRGQRSPARKPSQQVLAEVFSGGADIRSLIRAPDGRAPRILVGDADPAIRDRLHRVLSSAGCRVEELTDRRAAFAAIRAPPDLAIADAGLAQRNGYALLRRLRAHSATQWVPVILLAAEPGDRARREALEAGADDYLPKPFGARELLSRLGLHLAMARVGREASEAVRASERRLAEVLEAIGEAVFAIDRDQRILFANRTALQFWNRKAEEVLDRPLLDVFPEIESGRPYQAYLRVLATGRPEHIEAPAPAIGNRWIALDAYPAPEGGLVVAYRDIDDRRRAEFRLRQSEERLRLMVETLPDIAFVIRPDGMAEHYNQQMRDYVGGPVGPAPADRSSLHPPDDRDAVDKARAYAFATGTEFSVEARLRRHDGVYRWHRIRNR
ncbi:MAG: response regulator, partial [Alphaproteobacteria bacterium]